MSTRKIGHRQAALLEQLADGPIEIAALNMKAQISIHRLGSEHGLVEFTQTSPEGEWPVEGYYEINEAGRALLAARREG